MSAPAPLSRRNISGGLWQQLNADALDVPGSSEDIIGLEDVTGFEIQTETESATPTVSRTGLTQDLISVWLERCVGTEFRGGKIRGKVLIANQVSHQDGLCPPLEAAAVRFSRKTLCDRFGIPALALKRISRPASWYLDFSAFHSSCWKSCLGLGASRFSFLICADQERHTFCVLLVFYRAVKIDDRARLERDLETLNHFAGDVCFMPYLILQLIIGIESTQITEHDRPAQEAEHSMMRQASMREVLASHTRALQLAAVQIDASNGVKLAKRWSIASPAGTNNFELQQGIDFSRQVLTNIVDASKRSEAQSNRQLATVLSMLAAHQQGISVSIAEASKSIAEETKKDGTSMKTLAVVTMLFLPATSVSSIFAMPLFDWEQEGGRVVRSSIWVYFVFASCLTLLTVGIWWAWQRDLTQRNKTKDADAMKIV
jgi:hypothetical protein